MKTGAQLYICFNCNDTSYRQAGRQAGTNTQTPLKHLYGGDPRTLGLLCRHTHFNVPVSATSLKMLPSVTSYFVSTHSVHLSDQHPLPSPRRLLRCLCLLCWGSSSRCTHRYTPSTASAHHCRCTAAALPLLCTPGPCDPLQLFETWQCTATAATLVPPLVLLPLCLLLYVSLHAPLTSCSRGSTSTLSEPTHTTSYSSGMPSCTQQQTTAQF